jgi:hypothetical protein
VPRPVRVQLSALIELLRQLGPALGRPHADTLKGSKHANMKELRFNAADGHGGLRMHSIPSERRSSLSLATNLGSRSLGFTAH